MVESVGLVEIGFKCKDPPTDQPESGWVSQKPSPTRHWSPIRRFSDWVSQNSGWVLFLGCLGQA